MLQHFDGSSSVPDVEQNYDMINEKTLTKNMPRSKTDLYPAFALPFFNPALYDHPGAITPKTKQASTLEQLE